MNENKNYMVTWQMVQKYRKRGLLNRISGKTIKRLMPMKYKYECEEIAKYGYYNIKKNGGIKPHLVKVIV
jgi:predicted transcriptional regulator